MFLCMNLQFWYWSLRCEETVTEWFISDMLFLMTYCDWVNYWNSIATRITSDVKCDENKQTSLSKSTILFSLWNLGIVYRPFLNTFISPPNPHFSISIYCHFSYLFLTLPSLHPFSLLFPHPSSFPLTFFLPIISPSRTWPCWSIGQPKINRCTSPFFILLGIVISRTSARSSSSSIVRLAWLMEQGQWPSSKDFRDHSGITRGSQMQSMPSQ